MKTDSKYKVIYNPNSGKKRNMFGNPTFSLEDLKRLLEQYQIQADFTPTKSKSHIKELTKEAISEGYTTILVAGGDGTIGEAAQELIGTHATLGILPFGSYMNVARMLSIPPDLEKAVQLIKIGRIRKIDVGKITKLDGEKLSKPFYFLESAGIGLEAQLHEQFIQFEQGNLGIVFSMFKTFLEYYTHRPILILDDEEITTRANLISISNGPITGASLRLAPDAKLNDHRLTVSIFRLNRYELVRVFYKLFNQTRLPKKADVYQVKKVQIKTRKPRLVHADARVFGTTPITLEVVPNALSVITGFPKDGKDASLVSRTLLDP